MSLKQTVHRYLEEVPATGGPRLVQIAIMTIIMINVTAVVVETVPVRVEADGTHAKLVPLSQIYYDFFRKLELISVAIFTVEYLLRIWSITENQNYARPLLGRLRFVLTPLALVDLLAILPTFFFVHGFTAARILRLIRIFRIFKLARYSRALRSLNRALRSKRGELGVTIFVIGILLVLSSTVLYYAEYEAQPEKFSSIPAAMWWGIVTLTTVGYGDVSPITPFGKLAGGVVAIFGIGLVALPAGILGSAFIQEVSGRRKPSQCPHCGKDL